MPFTLAHPAAVVPLRRFAVLSALVIGSVMPDLLRFIPGMAKTGFGHSIPGLFLCCLPVGVAIFYAYQRYFRAPLIDLAPQPIRLRWPEASTPATPFAVALAVFIGAATHLLWDALTHEDSLLSRHWDFLNQRVFLFRNYSMVRSALLQDVSSIVGVAVVLGYIAYWLWQTPVIASARPTRLRRRFPLVAAATFGAFLPALLMGAHHPEYWLVNERRQFVELAITLAVPIFLAEFLVYAFWWHHVESGHAS